MQCYGSALHAGTVTTGGVKMAKSAGNLVLVSDLLASYPAAAVRLMILDRSWAGDWDYRPELRRCGGEAGKPVRRGWRSVPASPDAESGIARLLAADLNVPAAHPAVVRAVILRGVTRSR